MNILNLISPLINILFEWLIWIKLLRPLDYYIIFDVDTIKV
jgi:hypothetical protein